MRYVELAVSFPRAGPLPTQQLAWRTRGRIPPSQQPNAKRVDRRSGRFVGVHFISSGLGLGAATVVGVALDGGLAWSIGAPSALRTLRPPERSSHSSGGGARPLSALHRAVPEAARGYACQMSDHSLHDQLTKYLIDVHSIEVQTLEQVKRAPQIAGDPSLAPIFADHEERDARARAPVREQLQQGASPSLVKDAAGRVGGWGILLFVKFNPDTPGKLAMHAYACATPAPWRHSRCRCWRRVRSSPDSMRWRTSCAISSRRATISGSSTNDPRRSAGHPARVQAAAMRIGALNLGGFFKAESDTPVTIAGFAYALEALEAGDLLTRIARRAGDERTAALAERVLADARAAAEQVPTDGMPPST